jgi:hypothetical protein
MSDPQEMNLSRLMQHGTKEPTPLSEEFLSVVGHNLRKLARHHRRQLDEMELLTYMEGLRDLPLSKLQDAFSKGLLKWKKMPTVPEIRELVNEQAEFIPTNDPAPGKFCENCYPDGYILVDAGQVPRGPEGYRYKKVRRCPCQRGE